MARKKKSAVPVLSRKELLGANQSLIAQVEELRKQLIAETEASIQSSKENFFAWKQVDKPGVKDAAGKPPVFQGFNQYFPRSVRALAEISAYGARKYKLEFSDKNFLRVAAGEDKFRDGRDRHITGEEIDGVYDPESGMLHAAHGAWCYLAVLELMLKRGVLLHRDGEGK